MKALIFAAGLGTRLKPFTEKHPKALVEVNNRPMLERTIRRLMSYGINDIVINVHHFADQILRFLEENNNFGANIQISDETDLLLDTGGGIAKAARLLTDSTPILVCNTDILTDINISGMIDAHTDSGADVTLLAQDRTTSRYLYFNPETRQLSGWANIKTGETKPEHFTPTPRLLQRAFGGYHILSQKALSLISQMPPSMPFGIIPWYVENITNLSIYGYTPKEEYQWFDIGSPETLKKAENNFIE